MGIRVVGYQTVSPDTISHYLGVKVGDPYDPEKIRQSFQALWDVGLLENVSIEAEHGASGVTLVVTIEERPTIQDIEFTGNKKFSTTQLKDKLKEAKAEMHTGAPLSLREVAKARSALADYYAENGYRSATVDYRIDDKSKTEKKVVFVIDEGDKIKIASIHFQGNRVFKEWRIRQAMKKTKVNTWFRLLSETSTTYSQANYDADVENIKGLYQAKGYKNIVVKDPVLDIFVKNPQAKPKKQKKRVRITIPLVEGDQFFTNNIDIVKVNQSGQASEEAEAFVVPKPILLKEFKELPPGSVLNRDRLVEALSRVEGRYKSRGYIYWFADPTYKEVADHRVDVEVRLFEGDKFYLGRLEVQGNSSTRDKVIRREFALDEGAVMDMEAVKKSLQKLQQLGYFKVSEEPDFSVRPNDKKVDLTLKGTETSRNEVQFGAGYSALDGFFGQFSFQTRNFLGRGEILGASAQIGRISNYYNLSYTIPWFMDRNQTVGASVYSNDVNYPQRSVRSQPRVPLLLDDPDRLQRAGRHQRFLEAAGRRLRIHPGTDSQAGLRRFQHRGRLRAALRRAGGPDLRAVSDRGRAEPARLPRRSRSATGQGQSGLYRRLGSHSRGKQVFRPQPRVHLPVGWPGEAARFRGHRKRLPREPELRLDVGAQVGRARDAGLSADIPGAAALHLLLEPAPDHAHRSVRLPHQQPPRAALGV